MICGCDWWGEDCGYWEVKGKKTLWLLVWNCGHLVAKMWDELVFKYCWEITWWRVWGLRWHGEKRSIETGHKALLTTSMPANSQGSKYKILTWILLEILDSRISFTCFGTKFWFASPWDRAGAPSLSAAAWWGSGWCETPSPAPASDICNGDQSYNHLAAASTH